MLEHSEEDGSDYEGVNEDSNEDSDADFSEDSDEDSDEDVPIDVLRVWLVNSDRDRRLMALRTLGKLETVKLTQHAGLVVARLEDTAASVRWVALKTLGQLEPVTLAQYADPVVARLGDSVFFVRNEALSTVRKLEPEALAQHASAVIPRLEDSNAYVRHAAFTTVDALPLAVTRDIDLRSSNGRSQLLGRLAWYNYRRRVRMKRIALYWYALPYRPSGPGHARDVEAWGRMVEE